MQKRIKKYGCIPISDVDTPIMNQSKRSLYIKFLNDLHQMLIKIQRNASKELF